jgi:hypothetical protein
VSWYTISANYVLSKERFNCGGDPFHEIFDYDHCEGVIDLSWSQLSYDVDAPSLQRPRQGYQLHRLRQGLRLAPESLTCFACRN